MIDYCFLDRLGTHPALAKDATTWLYGPVTMRGKTFVTPKVVAEGYGAYSVLQRLEGGTVALLYEATPNTVIRLLILDLSDLFATHSSDEN